MPIGSVIVSVGGQEVLGKAKVIEAIRAEQKRHKDATGSGAGTPSAPKPLITPIFPDFSRFFPVFPWTSGRALWISGV